MAKKKAKRKTKTYTTRKVKVPKGYDKAIKNSIPLGDILSGKASLGNMMSGLTGGAGINLGTRTGGPGTHMPVMESGKTIGTMADGKKIWLKGPNKGKLV